MTLRHATLDRIDAKLVARCHVITSRLLVRAGYAGLSDAEVQAVSHALFQLADRKPEAGGPALIDLIEKSLDAPANPASVVEARTKVFIHPAGTFPFEACSDGNGVPEEWED